MAQLKISIDKVFESYFSGAIVAEEACRQIVAVVVAHLISMIEYSSKPRPVQ